MLAEKFFLFLETLMSHAADGDPAQVSSVPHVPINSADQETALHDQGIGTSLEPVLPDDKI